MTQFQDESIEVVGTGLRRHDALAITVNGEARAFPSALTVAGLVAALGLDTRKVAVELNREIVPRSTYAAVALRDGDVLEIVHFIGGG